MSAQPKPAPVSRLGAVRRGTLDTPLRHLYYGPEGVGKTTLGSHAPAAICYDVEGGSARVAIDRYPFADGPQGHVPRSLGDIYAALEDLRTADHNYKTLVIDTIDALEALVWRHVCARLSGVKNGINKSGKQLSSIEDLGYGKGYVCALDEFRLLCTELDRLRTDRGMAIVLLGHSHVRTFKNPIDEDFDRIQLRLHDKAAGFIKEWCDVVGFVSYEDFSKRDGDDDRARAKGYTTGRLLVHFQRSAAFDAKTRVPMPAELELPLGDGWAPIAAELEAGQKTSAKELVTRIRAELKRIGDDELTERVKSHAKAAGDDVATLSRYLNDLKTRSAKENAA